MYVDCLTPKSEALLRKLIALAGGSPYLIQSMKAVTEEPMTIETLVLQILTDRAERIRQEQHG